MKNSIRGLTLTILAMSIHPVLGYNRYYSLANNMAVQPDSVWFYFAWPQRVDLNYSSSIGGNPWEYVPKIYKANAPIAPGNFPPGTTIGWRWESTQSSGYDSYPYKIKVTWTENGQQKTKVTCLTATGTSKWAGDAHWFINADGSVSGQEGTDARKPIATKDVDTCDNCCYFDEREDEQWPDLGSDGKP